MLLPGGLYVVQGGGVSDTRGRMMRLCTSPCNVDRGSRTRNAHPYRGGTIIACSHIVSPCLPRRGRGTTKWWKESSLYCGSWIADALFRQSRKGCAAPTGMVRSGRIATRCGYTPLGAVLSHPASPLGDGRGRGVKKPLPDGKTEAFYAVGVGWAEWGGTTQKPLRPTWSASGAKRMHSLAFTSGQGTPSNF